MFMRVQAILNVDHAGCPVEAAASYGGEAREIIRKGEVCYAFLH